MCAIALGHADIIVCVYGKSADVRETLVCNRQVMLKCGNFSVEVDLV